MMQLPDKDNEFDDLIKAAADKYKASGANPDWDKMQTMLDAQMPVSKRPRIRGLYFLLIPLLLLLGGTYLYFNKTNNKLINPVKEQQSAAKSTGSVLSKTVADTTTVATINHNKNQQSPLLQKTLKLTTSATTHSLQKADADITNLTAAGSKKNSALLLQNKKTLHQNESVENKNKFARLQIKSNGHVKSNTVQAGVTENNAEPEKTKEEASSVSKNENTTGMPDKIAASSTENKIVEATVNKSSETKASSEKASTENKITSSAKNTSVDKINDNKRKNPWEFSLLYAPELTTINFNSIDKPGSNYGILLGYNISKSISIQTGIIKSKKNYTANGVDYKSGYTVMPPFKLTRVKGYCDMYEIPLNVKYDLTKRKNITVSAIAGISSYFMTGEYYSFQYNSYDSTYYRSRGYGTQKNYWLALATIAVGFEKQVSNNLSVGATPFLKIPFKGMGSGDLKLVGTGINFLLSYRPSFKK